MCANSHKPSPYTGIGYTCVRSQHAARAVRRGSSDADCLLMELMPAYQRLHELDRDRMRNLQDRSSRCPQEGLASPLSLKPLPVRGRAVHAAARPRSSDGSASVRPMASLREISWQRLFGRLAERGATGSCPVCANDSWTWGYEIRLPTVEPDGKLRGGYRLIPVFCTKCGFTRLHDRSTLFPEDEPASGGNQ